jgi:hypothetical protein
MGISWISGGFACPERLFTAPAARSSMPRTAVLSETVAGQHGNINLFCGFRRRCFIELALSA